MRTIVLCEGTTDLLMLQFVLQYKYGWKYKGFVENTVSNRLVKRTLMRGDDYLEINSCGGLSNIANELAKLKDMMELATKQEEMYDRVVVMIDHDTITSNQEFIQQVNDKIETGFTETQMNVNLNWHIQNAILGEKIVDLFMKCIPDEQTGAIETILLQALGTDEIEIGLIEDSKQFITYVAGKQERYLQKRSRISKATFNTYFAIRIPEEKYDERARVLKAYDWENNPVLNENFSFLEY